MNSVLNFYRHEELREIEARAFKVFTDRNLDQIPALDRLSDECRFEMKVVASVLPFRVNEYIIEELIDWDQVPNDPIYQLTFPQRDMLEPEAFDRMAELHRRGADRTEIVALARQLRDELNPHPAGQMEMNRPELDGEPLQGLQHKYRETVLFFPSQGQTCHAYCTFCFRWAQFVGDKSLRIASNQASDMLGYLRVNPEVSDILITGGDPMVMKTKHLAQYLEPLMGPEFEHVQTVRIGTKALTFWPHRFVSDADADDLVMLLERLVKAGKHVAIMAHYNHWREMETPMAREAIRRLRATGAEIRSQGPLLAHINDDPAVWARIWENQVRLGIIPYYMFAERDTGARRYFEVPLARAWEIYRDAMKQVSGLGRTARGPSMSAGPGKVEIQGVTEIHGEKVFVLRFIQGRNPEWVQRPFFARYDEEATWLHHLKPAFGEEKFFFEEEYEAMQAGVA
ncbi:MULTISPECIES: KamA family radical SAM protein [unclassified Ectothiorhodospira]|uniref:KamA family radical SAM protein n=1 Tax=unclassified Ectothiorhodospira TaxID=2684909 RepID=UPI001EE79D7E|nr:MULTISPECIES: lysine 2,3-aminomutase [unclassified Ectothiorhodospira]MCG5514558.1 lysine 2,3-aminomutase [Ectothiorhodospira sp. 9100]MCG5518638.1 lysine 2,3-aminomutase [Ectothiorhodospira sp. 9905]